ncbi:hypothetical protein D3C72_1597800 [compost metagenome]
MHHKVADIGRLGDKPGGRGADIWPNFRHDRAAAHLQQTVPAAVKLRADQRNAVKPRQIRHGHLTAGDPTNHRPAGIDKAVNQERNRNDKDQKQQQRHHQNGGSTTTKKQFLQT